MARKDNGHLLCGDAHLGTSVRMLLGEEKLFSNEFGEVRRCFEEMTPADD